MPDILDLRKLAVSLAVFAIIAFGTAMPAQADPITFVLSGADFSGPTVNTGGNITVNIQNIAGGVRITVTNNLVDAGAFLGGLYLNTTVAPLANAAGACVTCTATNGQTMAFNFGSNAFQADGDGLYDIWVDFSTVNADRLTPGESIVFDLTSTSPGFTSDSFLTLSAPGGGNGPFQVAAHIQGYPGGASDWITTTVPEPASMFLFASGLIGAAGVARRKLKSRQ
jgi:PEP-CTERM motif